MSSEVWNINVGAEEFYNNVKNAMPFKAEMMAVGILTKVCEEMVNTYDEILQEQKDYITELDGELDDLTSFKSEQNEKLQKLFDEIKVLEQKEQDGTITEDEQNDLESKKTEYHSLSKSTTSSISEKNDKIQQTKTKQDEKYRSKVRVAEDYGKNTVEKGTPLAETEVKGGFFRKLFGSTGRDKKEVGEKAVEVGNNLLDKVSESTDIDTEFSEKLKTKK